MHREELVIGTKLQPSVATFIKHGFQHHVRWPTLPLGVVLANTSTAINEEWLTVVESMPTYKVFHEFVEQVIEGALFLCVYLKKTQSETDTYVSMFDFDYYIVRPDATLVKVQKPPELRETLVHTFLDYRLKNTKTIELVAFSSGTTINEDLVNNMTFLDSEVFHREYANIKGTFPAERRSTNPFRIIAPRGAMRIFLETYSWIDTRAHFVPVMEMLRRRLVEDARSNQIQVTDDLSFDDSTASKYSPATKTLLVRDLVTMCVANFFGCNAQLGTYHRFDVRTINIDAFVKAVNAAFDKITKLV
uniref:DNA-directed RNA polymerase 35 kDa subunit n=1 Tax=Rousettus bat poxvirus TaxID=3141933 RepID=A0AAU7E2B6_9POXV